MIFNITYKPIPVPTADGHIFLSPLEIKFIEAIHNGCLIYSLRQPTPYIVSHTLKKLLGRLPQDAFQQVHKSFIVCLQHMEGTNKTNTRIYFSGTKEVAVGETFRSAFLLAAGFDIQEPGSASDPASSAPK